MWILILNVTYFYIDRYAWGGGLLLSTKQSESGISEHFYIFVLAYPQPQTGNEIYQNKTWQFSLKTRWKLQLHEIKMCTISSD